MQPPGQIKFRRRQGRQFPSNQGLHLALIVEHYVGGRSVPPKHVDRSLGRLILKNIIQRRIDIQHWATVGAAFIPGLDMTNILVNPRIAPVRIGKKVEAILLPIQPGKLGKGLNRSEEITSELQSLMRISYAVFCLKKKT